jgi:hypothetical protein
MTTAQISLLSRLLDPLTDSFTPEVARRLADLRADATTQARVDELARNANRGQLSNPEVREYETHIEANEILGLLQAKARAYLDHTAS